MNHHERAAGRTGFLAVIATIIAVAVAGELVLGWLFPALRNRHYDAFHTGGHPIEANSRGYRGEETPGDGRLILALGDSTTFGTGVAVDESWAAQLEAAIAARDGSDCTVLNGGLPATDVSQLAQALDSDWKDVRVEAVLLAVCGNMVSLALIRPEESVPLARRRPQAEAPQGKSPTAHLRRLISESALLGGVTFTGEHLGYLLGVNHHRIDPAAPYGAMLAHGWRQAGLPPDLANSAWNRLELQVAELARRCQERGIRMIVTWIPSRFTISQGWRDNLKQVPLDRLTIDPNERCRLMCERLGLPFVDSLTSMRRWRQDGLAQGSYRDLYVPSDYTHLDSQGHRAIAEAFLDALSPAETSAPSP